MNQERLNRAIEVAKLIEDLKDRSLGLQNYLDTPQGRTLQQTNITLSISGHVYDGNTHAGCTNGKFGTENKLPQALKEAVMEKINNCLRAICTDFECEITRLEQEFETL